METLILTAEHRNQYYVKKTPGHRSSAPSKTFRQINCRTFHSGVGLLPTPSKTSLPQAHSCGRTSPIPIANNKGSSQIRRSSSDKRRSLSYSELWAGPTYSNSPPPTSLPMPNFSLRQNRTVSLTFPAPHPDVDIRQLAKSAPVSPTSSSADNNPFHTTTVSATMTLRRMLNLETAEDE